MFIYYLFTLFWGVTMTLIDQLSYGHVTAYLINLLIACSLFISKKRTFILLHVFPIVILAIGFILLISNPNILIGHFINITVFWIFAALCSRLIYRQTVKSFEQELRLNEQNKELNRLNQHLEFLANKDSLTELANRHYLTTYLRNKLVEPQNMMIIMVDIDSFKQYNDYYGHIKGDEVLKEVAQVLQTIADKYQLFAARLGGEEFILIGLNLSEEQATIIAKEVCYCVEQLHIPHEKSKTESYITISLGFIVNQVNTMSDFDTALHLADQALYKAKENGGNQATYYHKKYEKVLTNFDTKVLCKQS